MSDSFFMNGCDVESKDLGCSQLVTFPVFRRDLGTLRAYPTRTTGI
jgi:hypothetical protein